MYGNGPSKRTSLNLCLPLVNQSQSRLKGCQPSDDSLIGHGEQAQPKVCLCRAGLTGSLPGQPFACACRPLTNHRTAWRLSTFGAILRLVNRRQAQANGCPWGVPVTGSIHEQALAYACRSLTNHKPPEGCQPLRWLCDWQTGNKHKPKISRLDSP